MISNVILHLLFMVQFSLLNTLKNKMHTFSKIKECAPNHNTCSYFIVTLPVTLQLHGYLHIKVVICFFSIDTGGITLVEL